MPRLTSQALDSSAEVTGVNGNDAQLGTGGMDSSAESNGADIDKPGTGVVTGVGSHTEITGVKGSGAELGTDVKGSNADSNKPGSGVKRSVDELVMILTPEIKAMMIKVNH